MSTPATNACLLHLAHSVEIHRSGPGAAVAANSDIPAAPDHSIGTAAPGSRVHHILTASRAGRARFELAAEELRAVAAAGGPSDDSEAAARRPAVPSIGSAAAGGLQPVGDTVRPVYGAGVARPDRRTGPSAAGTFNHAASFLGVLSTDETAAGAAHGAGAAATARPAAKPTVIKEETVIIATEADLPVAVKTAAKVQAVVVRLIWKEAGLGLTIWWEVSRTGSIPLPSMPSVRVDGPLQGA